MTALRTGVIGVGHLGSYHAEKYAALSEARLIAVVDIDARRGREVAARFGCEFFQNYRDLHGVDAVSIAVPTALHYEVARHFMERGVHVLVEKPITATLTQADALVELAQRRAVCLQVGHLERFNSVVQAMVERVGTPQFIESTRLAPFTPRGADVNVILDLMIHDIDIILSLVGQPVSRIDANGVRVISDDIDIANTRLQFSNGCVANVTASRASLKKERKMRLFQPNTYLALDFLNGSLEIRRRDESGHPQDYPEILSEEVNVGNGDALLSEIAAFLASVRTGQPPVISGTDGREALATAIAISHHIRDNPLPTATQLNTEASAPIPERRQ